MSANSCMLRLVRWFSALLIMGVASSAFAFGTTARFVILTNQDSGFSTTGVWTSVGPPPVSTSSNPTFYGEFYLRVAGSGGAETATARWEFGVLAPSPGSYSFDAFIPDTLDNAGTAVIYRLESAPFGLFSGCGTYTTVVTFAPVNADNFEGRWLQVGTQALITGTCYRLVLTNANNAGDFILANAVRAERLFESSVTVTDMPRLATAFAPGTTFVASTSTAVPTIVTTLTVTCPQVGSVMVTGSGESTAQSNFAGTAFIGLAYSISRNNTASDASNVVQSSALAVFNGDANRDFLSVSRVDSCTANESITYRLTVYRSQAAAGPASFVWNGRLIGQYFATSF